MLLIPDSITPVEPGYERVNLFTLGEGNKWVIPKNSRSMLQTIGFRNNLEESELLQLIKNEAAIHSKKYSKRRQETIRAAIAGMVLLPAVPLSVPLIISSTLKHASLPKLAEEYLTTVNEFLSNDERILGFQRATGVKLFASMDSMFELGTTKIPTCVIYLDFPISLIM